MVNSAVMRVVKRRKVREVKPRSRYANGILAEGAGAVHPIATSFVSTLPIKPKILGQGEKSRVDRKFMPRLMG